MKRRMIRWAVDARYTISWIEEKRYFLGFEYWVKIVQNRPLSITGDYNEQIFKLLCSDKDNYISYME